MLIPFVVVTSKAGAGPTAWTIGVFNDGGVDRVIVSAKASCLDSGKWFISISNSKRLQQRKRFTVTPPERRRLIATCPNFATNLSIPSSCKKYFNVRFVVTYIYSKLVDDKTIKLMTCSRLGGNLLSFCVPCCCKMSTDLHYEQDFACRSMLGRNMGSERGETPCEKASTAVRTFS